MNSKSLFKLTALLLVLLPALFALFSCGESEAVLPALYLEGDNPLVLALGQSYEEPGFVALDSFDGDISNRVKIQDYQLNLKKPGSYTVIYSVVSRNGERAEVVRTVEIVQSISSISVQGENPQIMTLGETWYDFGVRAIDIDGSDLFMSVTSDGDNVVNTRVPGRYIVTYQFDDSVGVTRTATRDVYVVLKDKPVIVLQGAGQQSGSRFKVEENSTADVPGYLGQIEPGYSAFDNTDGDITDQVTVNYGDADVSATGETLFELTYSVANSSGVSADPVTRFCLLTEDATAPLVSLNGLPNLTIECGVGTYTEAGATATDYDRSGGILTSGLAVSKSINKMEGDSIVQADMSEADMLLFPGIYHIVYSAADAFGNVGTAYREVRIDDTIAPVMTYKGVEVTSQVIDEVTVNFADALNAVAEDATATDQSSDFALDVIGDRYSAISSRVAGVYQTTFIAEDSSGNRAPKVIRKVTVLPPPDAPVINGDFEDFAPDVGKNVAPAGQPADIIGWQFNFRGYLKEGTWNQWGEWLNSYTQAIYTGYGGEYAKPILYATNGDFSETEGRKVFVKSGMFAVYTNKAIMTQDTTYAQGIPIDSANYITRSMGTLYQEGIRVYKDIEYRAEFWAMALNGRNQTITCRVKSDTQGLELDEAQSTVLQTVYDPNREPQNKWIKKVILFKTNMDGDIRLELFKSDCSGDGTEIWFDAVAVSPVTYPVKQ